MYLFCIHYSYATLDRANSRFRIGLMFSMMGLATIGSIIAVRQGRRERQALHDGADDAYKKHVATMRAESASESASVSATSENQSSN